MAYYLIYSSTARGEMTAEVLGEITHISRKNNAMNEITGMLLGMESKYIQYLEGDKQKITALMQNIRKDSRHFLVTVLVEGYTDKRVFSEWSMGSWLLGKEELQSLPAIEDLRNFMEDESKRAVPPNNFIAMMNALLNTWINQQPESASILKG